LSTVAFAPTFVILIRFFHTGQREIETLAGRSFSATSISRQMIFGSYLSGSCKELKRRELTGGAEGDRTPDLRIANAALCQTELLPHTRATILGSVFEGVKRTLFSDKLQFVDAGYRESLGSFQTATHRTHRIDCQSTQRQTDRTFCCLLRQSIGIIMRRDHYYSLCG
jgi:hypothetical protein